jgi:membrane protein DedA with SNARE-associated domain
MAATLVSEDLACVTAGLLIREGRIGLGAGIAACALGILLGDIGLWGLGRASRRLIERWPGLARRLERLPLDEMRGWLARNAAGAMVASRFMPGTRLPLYVCAGHVGMSLALFTAWASIAVLLWTPAVVWLATGASDTVLAFLPSSGVFAWMSRAVLAVGLVSTLKSVPALLARVRSSAPAARLARWSRWEFWPMWLFYGPVALWIVVLAIRHRGFATITASNPGIPDGGIVGESKFQILANLPGNSVISSGLVGRGSHSDPAVLADRALTTRVDDIMGLMRDRRWTFPLVLKPDVGQRGVGVRLAAGTRDVAAYCAEQPGAILVQPYHPGPFEAGVFYYRFPHEARGRIFSITDKCFPEIVGDGRASIEELIETHPRYRVQAALFLTRHHAGRHRVLQAGERFRLAIAGNHAQGTLFREGAHLYTPALERRIDEIARACPGFYIGRFDVRYGDVDAFKAGHDLAIVELNGATAESTNIYDPDTSLLDAYRQLFVQWSLVFAIGAANRAAGAPVSSTRRLLGAIGAHLASKPALAISD